MSSCLVCGVSCGGVHFGVDSCRACAAFFRRSVVLHREYVCRSGTASCSIGQSAHRICRKCRYAKCLQVGMLPENVKLRRLPPSPPPLDAPLSPRPLQRICDCYSQMTVDRLSSELDLSEELCQGDEYPVFQKCTMPLLDKIMRDAVPILSRFCINSFPEFMDLDMEDRWVIFRQFLGFLIGFESGFRTARFMDKNTKKRLITLTTYHDYGEPITRATLEKEETPMHGTLIEMIRQRLDSPQAELLRGRFRGLALDDIEAAAFLSIGLWSPSANTVVSDSTHLVCDRIRQCIFSDLHVYYVESRGVEEYASRMGEIMTLIVSLQGSLSRESEENSLLLAFGVVEKDTFMYSLLKGQ